MWKLAAYVPLGAKRHARRPVRASSAVIASQSESQPQPTYTSEPSCEKLAEPVKAEPGDAARHSSAPASSTATSASRPGTNVVPLSADGESAKLSGFCATASARHSVLPPLETRATPAASATRTWSRASTARLLSHGSCAVGRCHSRSPSAARAVEAAVEAVEAAVAAVIAAVGHLASHWLPKLELSRSH